MNDNTLKSGSLLKKGEYSIIRVLGQGGFGITYEAEQVSLGRRVAVKEFFMKDYCDREDGSSHVTLSTSSSSRELVERFRTKFVREARMIAGLDHDHIVKIYDVFEENGTAYYVMEYLGGGSLDRKMREEGVMSEEKALGYIRQVSDALGYLHSQNILHFDVKPSNVLLGKNGSAKLIDFGISKHYDEAGVQTSSTPVGISKGYAPLEQYQQGSDIKSFTPATDIYSLGATLFALLAGANPPEASVVGEEGLPSKPWAISTSVWKAIEKAMSFRRKDRPQSVAEFLELLDGTAKEDDDEQTVVPTPAVKGQKSEKAGTPAQKSKGFPKWLYGLIAGVAVAVLAAVLLNRPDKTDAPDNLQTDSTSVVAEAKQEKPVTSKPSSSATKPEAPAVVELKSISLSKTTLELEEGSSTTLTVKYSPNNASDKTTTWKSSNANVAKVSSSGKVTALKSGSAAIIASCQGKIETCTVTVTLAGTGIHNGHEWVDLGLSVKWAVTNVDATRPGEYGDYFAWAETKPKNDYSWSTLKYCNDTSGDSFSKYNQNQGGTIDNKTRLDLSDDAARANWGGDWRMPTEGEFQELIDNCTWTWTTINGKKGYKVVSRSNGNSIFLPAAGNRNDTGLYGAGSTGHYWSSSLSESNSFGARGLHFHPDFHHTDGDSRRIGRSVRPVLR